MSKCIRPISRSARLCDPTYSVVAEQADALRNKILNARCALPPESGQKWYISNNGNDNNDGHTPDSALETVTAVLSRMQEGDSVLFECGSLFRGVEILVKSNMFFGSYGEGAKPYLYASPENSAESAWSKVDDNIWKSDTVFDTLDVGVIVFNEGEATGEKKFAMEDLKKDLDFFFDGAHVYVYYNQNPSEAFFDIEVCPRINIFLMGDGIHDVTFDNLTIKYTGWTGILGSGDTRGITIRNCEIGWCGGITQRDTIRMGGGIGFWNGCQDTLVENCWVYQSYDSGISPQGNREHVEKNIVVRNNLIEYCGYASYEYWVHPAPQASLKDVLVTDNIMRFPAAGFGIEGRPVWAPHIRSNSGLDNLCTNFLISGNVLEGGANGGDLFYCESSQNTLPVFKNNLYIQAMGEGFGVYDHNVASVHDVIDIQRYIREILKDETGTFILSK